MNHPAGEEGQRPEPIIVHGLSFLFVPADFPNYASHLTVFFAETPKFDLDVYIANYSGEHMRPSTVLSLTADRPRQGGQDSVVSTSLGNAHQLSASKPSKLL
jgi:hypothetical protein